MSEPNLTIRDLVRTIVPWWMQQTNGYAYLYSIAQVADLLVQQAVESARLGFPSHCQEEALPYHGRDRGLRRGPLEPRASFSTRLKAWRTTAKKIGTAAAILRSVQTHFIGWPLGTPQVRLVTNTGTWFTIDPGGDITRVVSLPNPSNWDWDSHPELWDRFWIIIYASEVGWDRDGTWGDGELWGNDGGSTIGSTATPDDVLAIRQLVADAQGADALCVSIIISFDDAAFWPDSSGTLPDGLWKNHGKYDGSGNRVVARSEDALYWDGTS
jgi:hypothetical protein